MKAAVRCNALNLKKLIQQELHGKRLDRSSQRRRVRQAKPLVLDGVVAELSPRRIHLVNPCG